MIPRRPRLPFPAAALAVAAGLAGCGDITFSDDDAPLQTDRQAYDLRRDDSGVVRVEIPYTYRNTTGRTVYLVNCGGATPPSLDRWEAGEWRTVWSPIVPACLSDPIVVAPGATYADTLHVAAVPPWSSASPHFEVLDPAGVYRLLWPYPRHDYDTDDPAASTLLPLRDRVSNGFELREP